MKERFGDWLFDVMCQMWPWTGLQRPPAKRHLPLPELMTFSTKDWEEELTEESFKSYLPTFTHQKEEVSGDQRNLHFILNRSDE